MDLIITILPVVYFIYMYILYICKDRIPVVVFFTLTDRASTIPINIRGCQSGTWSQRGTKVNGSHHGDRPATQTNRDPNRDKK